MQAMGCNTMQYRLARKLSCITIEAEILITPFVINEYGCALRNSGRLISPT